MIGGDGTDKIIAVENNTAIGLTFSSPDDAIEIIDGNGFTNVTIVAPSTGGSINLSATTLIGIASINGAAGSDVIYGSQGSDSIMTFGGDDYIDDTGGTDYIDGGAGTDTFFLGWTSNGRYSSSQSSTDPTTWNLINSGTVGVASYTVTFLTNGNHTVKGSDGRVSNLSNIERLTFYGGGFGSAGNDTFGGGTGDETYYGFGGNDTLTGGGGKDTLYGGSGADTFRYTKVTDSAVGNGDMIMDFPQSEGDRVDLSAIDANTSIAGDQAFSFIGSAAFSGSAGEVRSEFQADGNTHVFGTVPGTTPSFEIVLVGNVTLTASNFIL